MSSETSVYAEAKHEHSVVERIAFVLIDGLADIHIPALANLTPLEAADTPTMDAVAGKTLCVKLCGRRQVTSYY